MDLTMRRINDFLCAPHILLFILLVAASVVMAGEAEPTAAQDISATQAKIVAASAVMALAVWVASLVLAPWIGAGGVKSVLGLCLLIGLGVSVYGVAALGLRATSVAELKAGFRR